MPPLPPDPGPFDYLRHFMESAIPRAFSLPEDIRGYFKDGNRPLEVVRISEPSADWARRS